MMRVLLAEDDKRLGKLIQYMPGLPKVPAAMHIDIVNGQIEGLS